MIRIAKTCCILFVVFLGACADVGQFVPTQPDTLPNTARTFDTAKKWLYEKVYFDHRETLYCGCSYSKARKVFLSTCGLSTFKGVSRAKRIEAEHVFPASQFGNFRQCWREPKKVCGAGKKGRACCEKSDPLFRTAHNDLHNLFPAVGYINGKRSNLNWGMVNGEPRTFGRCDFEIDTAIRRAEPPEHARGVIARTMLYMADIYAFSLSQQDRQLYAAWNNQYPPDNWEITRNERIRAIQGLGNPYIERYGRL